MKKLFSILVAVLITTALFGQVPQKMSYQAVIRDAGNKLITNHTIGMRVSILQGSVSGTEVYKEIFNPNPQTNVNGLVTIEIGGGIALTGRFDTINWAKGPYFIKTETDPTGGTNYSITGTSQLLSVPYALFSANGDKWGNQTVICKTPLTGNGVIGDSLKISPGKNTQVLSTNLAGNIVWRNSSFLNGGSAGNYANGYTPTSWTIFDFNPFYSKGTSDDHLFLKFYSATARTLYIRPLGNPYQYSWVIVDIAAGRTVLVAVSAINGQIEWYSSSNDAISWDLVGVSRN